MKFDNDLHVPVNKVVRVHLTSRDVIHSFYLPNLRLRQDAVPGRTILVWFEATKPGKYEIVLQTWKYVDYKKGTNGEFVNSRYIDISNKVSYVI